MHYKRLEKRVSAMPEYMQSLVKDILIYHPMYQGKEGEKRMLELIQNAIPFTVEYEICDLIKPTYQAAIEQGYKPKVEEFWWGTYDVFHGRVFNERGRNVNEVLDYAESELKKRGLEIDEYFCKTTICKETTWPIGYWWLVCFAVTGGSEGHYIHVEWLDKERKLHPLFLGKTFQGMEFATKVAGALAEILEA